MIAQGSDIQLLCETSPRRLSYHPDLRTRMPPATSSLPRSMPADLLLPRRGVGHLCNSCEPVELSSCRHAKGPEPPDQGRLRASLVPRAGHRELGKLSASYGRWRPPRFFGPKGCSKAIGIYGLGDQGHPLAVRHAPAPRLCPGVSVDASLSSERRVGHEGQHGPTGSTDLQMHRSPARPEGRVPHHGVQVAASAENRGHALSSAARPLSVTCSSKR